MFSYIKKDGEIMSQTTLDKKEVITACGNVDHIGLMLNNVKLIREVMV